MNRKHNINYDINFSEEDGASVDWDGELSKEDIFFVYEVSSWLVNSLYWQNAFKPDTELTKEQIKELAKTSENLRILAKIAGNTLKGMEDTIDEINDILKNKEDNDTDEV